MSPAPASRLYCIEYLLSTILLVTHVEVSLPIGQLLASGDGPPGYSCLVG